MTVGAADGCMLGLKEGRLDGPVLGEKLGVFVGANEGTLLGKKLGFCDGAADGVNSLASGEILTELKEAFEYPSPDHCDLPR